MLPLHGASISLPTVRLQFFAPSYAPSAASLSAVHASQTFADGRWQGEAFWSLICVWVASLSHRSSLHLCHQACRSWFFLWAVLICVYFLLCSSGSPWLLLTVTWVWLRSLCFIFCLRARIAGLSLTFSVDWRVTSSGSPLVSLN